MSKENDEKHTGWVVEVGETISVQKNWSNNSNTKQQKNNISSSHHNFNRMLQ